MIKLKKEKIDYDENLALTITGSSDIISQEYIEKIYQSTIDKNNEDLLRFYEPMMNKSYYESFMTQILHMEILIRKLISNRENINIDDFWRSDLYDLINFLFIENVINEERGRELHELRNKRNRLAHKFLAQTNPSLKDQWEDHGMVLVKIIEINDLIIRIK